MDVERVFSPRWNQPLPAYPSKICGTLHFMRQPGASMPSRMAGPWDAVETGLPEIENRLFNVIGFATQLPPMHFALTSLSVLLLTFIDFSPLSLLLAAASTFSHTISNLCCSKTISCTYQPSTRRMHSALQWRNASMYLSSPTRRVSRSLPTCCGGTEESSFP